MDKNKCKNIITVNILGRANFERFDEELIKPSNQINFNDYIESNGDSSIMTKEWGVIENASKTSVTFINDEIAGGFNIHIEFETIYSPPSDKLMDKMLRKMIEVLGIETQFCNLEYNHIMDDEIYGEIKGMGLFEKIDSNSIYHIDNYKYKSFEYGIDYDEFNKIPFEDMLHSKFETYIINDSDDDLLFTPCDEGVENSSIMSYYPKYIHFKSLVESIPNKTLKFSDEQTRSVVTNEADDIYVQFKNGMELMSISGNITMNQAYEYIDNMHRGSKNVTYSKKLLGNLSLHDTFMNHNKKL